MKFENVVGHLPVDIISKGIVEHRTNCIGLNWKGGSLFFGENRGVGEFVLHVFNDGDGQEFYAPYPVFRNTNQADLEEINEMSKDLLKFKTNLLS